LLIGVLDSIHFHPPLETHTGEIQYSTRVLSVFDLVATPLRERVEKTYSAPFATHLYAKETVTLPDGRQIRDYPRLEYGGAHLNDPEIERRYDIVQTIVWASLEALAIWALVAGLSIALLARHWHMRWREGLKAVVGGHTELPWQVILVTAGVLIGLAVVATHLSSHYHILGTDKVGQDVFYQSLKSIRTGLVIGTLTTLVMLPFAILLGIMAGYFS